jgi:hypothetical protein
MITSPRGELRPDTFYKKYTAAFGIPIVCSEKSSNAPLLIARDIANYKLVKRMDIRSIIYKLRRTGIGNGIL